MSWFSEPVEYRRYADGTVEIIERRSLLKMLGAGAAAASLVAAGFFVAPRLAPPSPSSGPPPVRIGIEIVKNQDYQAVYRVLASYDRLHPIAKTDFWTVVAHLGMTDLLPFAEFQRGRETDVDVIQSLETSLRALRRRKAEEER